MNIKIRNSLFAAGLLTMALGTWTACAGDPPDDNGTTDASPNPQPTTDAGPEPVTLSVSGTVRDYFSGDPLSNTDLATEGLLSQRTTKSAQDGTYSIDQIPTGSKLFVDLARTDIETYRPTRSAEIDLATNNMSLEGYDLYLVSKQEIQRQHSAAGPGGTLIPLEVGTAFVVIDLVRNNGTALVGIPADDIRLLDEAGDPVGTGPFFYGADGKLAPQADVTASVADGTGKTRAAFLNVPPGAHKLFVRYPSGGGGGGGGGGELKEWEIPVAAKAEGASLVRTGGKDGNAIVNPTFATNVYPLLQRASAGGQGCASCHTQGGTAAAQPFDLPAEMVYANLIAKVGLIDTANPALSLLLTMPLYEAENPDGHPNATWLSTADPAYQLVLAWIQAGALQ